MFAWKRLIKHLVDCKVLSKWQVLLLLKRYLGKKSDIQLWICCILQKSFRLRPLSLSYFILCWMTSRFIQTETIFCWMIAESAFPPIYYKAWMPLHEWNSCLWVSHISMNNTLFSFFSLWGKGKTTFYVMNANVYYLVPYLRKGPIALFPRLYFLTSELRETIESWVLVPT